MNWIPQLFDHADFPPRWLCGNWSEFLGWTHIASDALIFLAYMAIPFALIYFAKKKSALSFPWVFWLFVGFIAACGLTHLTEVFMFWFPSYRFLGLMKAITAMVSLLTVMALLPLIPKALTFGSATDILEKIDLKSSEIEQNRVRSALLAAVVDTNDDAILSLDALGNIRTCNKAFFRLSGASERDAVTRNLMTWVAPDDKLNVLSMIESALEQDYARSQSVVLNNERGQPIFVEMFMSKITDSKSRVLGVSLIIRDIRRRVEAERKMLAAKDNFEDLFQNAPVLYVAVAPDTGTITECNQTMLAKLGYTRDQVVGQHILDMYHSDSLKDARRAFERSIETGRVVNAELALKRSDGSKLLTLLNVESLRDEHGKILLSRRVWQDISEIKKLQQRLEAKTQALEFANQELKSFSYSASHDMRAPVRAILGYSQAILEDFGEAIPDGAQDLVERIGKNGERMSALIEGLLKLTQVSRDSVRRVSIDLGGLARDIHLALPERADVSLECVGDLSANADENLVRILLANLIENSIKYQDSERPLKVTLRRETQNGKRVFVFADNGLGFDMKHAEKIFQPFQRAHSSRVAEGSGIGLATVSRIALRHEGKIWAEGEENVGATFFFTLS